MLTLFFLLSSDVDDVEVEPPPIPSPLGLPAFEVISSFDCLACWIVTHVCGARTKRFRPTDSVLCVLLSSNFMTRCAVVDGGLPCSTQTSK